LNTICRYYKLRLFLCASLCSLQSFAQNLPAKVVSLNDQWMFSKDTKNTYQVSGLAGLPWENINLPHTWNTMDVLDDEPGYYRGTGWYQRKLKTGSALKGKQLFLRFSGAGQVAEVFINGQLAGRHTGGYSRFIVPVSKWLNYTDDEIAVKVHNEFNEDIAPLTADFTFFGGIYRNVDLIIADPVHFTKTDHGSSGIYISTPNVSDESAAVTVKSLIDNTSSATRRLRVTSRLMDADGRIIASSTSATKVVAGAQTTVSHQFKSVRNPKLWSPDKPYLYRMVTTISDQATKEVLDEATNPVGFRWFRFDASEGFFLNGKPLKLIGASRHQDYENLGNAVPDALQIRDVELLKEMGGNLLRIAHYPQDPQILEACDRLGILASVEIPVVNTITESSAFTKNCIMMQKEMIRQNYNHPSIVIWAYMNEVLLRPKFTDDKPRQEVYYGHIRQLAKTLDSLTRAEDPSRYTMIANHGAFDLYHKVGLTKIPMLVGWNLYSGWYSGSPADFAKFLDRHHQELPDRPLLVTEYGADADPRIRSFQPVRFDKSIEYALAFNQVYLDEMIKRPFVNGAMAWNLADFNSETREETMPHINNKGLLTIGRKPKDTYYLYQAYLLNRPFLKIASASWNKRSGFQDSTGTCSTQPIQVATNLKNAELFLNGKSLGIKEAVSHICTWQVPFLNGQNKLSVVSGDQRDEMEVDFVIPKTSFYVLLGAGRYYTNDKLHERWMPARVYSKGSWGTIGGTAFKGTNNRMSYGSDKNILGTDDDPVYQTQQVGIEQFRFDVPDGEYELTLHFAELIGGATKEALAYNLDNNHVKEKAEQRVFTVDVNGDVLLNKVNIAAAYGYTTAVSKKTRVSVNGGKGISINFKAIEGKAILNAVQLRQIY
jgi:beta-galactosidase